MKILFVCTGNSCRSVIAEVLLGQLAKKRGLSAWEARSCGIAANPDFPTPEEVGLVLSERGVSFNGRRPVAVSSDLMEWADIVLPMTNGHREDLLSRHPEHRDKVKLFLEFSGGKGDVSDPIGQPADAYRLCRDTLQKALESILENHAANRH